MNRNELIGILETYLELIDEHVAEARRQHEHGIMPDSIFEKFMRDLSVESDAVASLIGTLRHIQAG